MHLKRSTSRFAMPLGVVLSVAVVMGAQGSANAADTKGPPIWSYEGPTGPEHWAELDEDFAACASKIAQSPIDIRTKTAIDADFPSVDLSWTPFTPNVENRGYTVQINPIAAGDGGFARLGDVDYQLMQYHFHHLSEHVFNGRAAPMEVHFVHRSEAGDLLVIGVMIEEGEPNPALTDLWEAIPSEPRTEKPGSGPVDAAALLPESDDAYRYMGSLTTPPCSEIVTWHVMTDPVTASAEQIADFAAIVPNNARPVQALSRRFILTE